MSFVEEDALLIPGLLSPDVAAAFNAAEPSAKHMLQAVEAAIVDEGKRKFNKSAALHFWRNNFGAAGSVGSSEMAAAIAKHVSVPHQSARVGALRHVRWQPFGKLAVRCEMCVIMLTWMCVSSC